MSFHQTIVQASLSSDPELKFTPSGKAVCKFSLPVTEKWSDGEKTTWYNCSAWGKTGEIINEHFQKGSPILVTGVVEAQAYMGKDDTPKSSLNLTVRSFNFVNGKASKSQDESDEIDTSVTEDEIPF